MRHGETDRFPLGRLHPVILLWIENGKLMRKSFNWSYGHDYAEFLAELEVPNREQVQLIGAWTGQWKTDVFALDIEKFKTKIREVI